MLFPASGAIVVPTSRHHRRRVTGDHAKTSRLPPVAARVGGRNDLPEENLTETRPNLIANRVRLIANEMHSRKELSACKHGAYEILIANEFHFADSDFCCLQTPKKLDSSLSLTKHSTSQFLIVNFRGVISPASSFEPPVSSSNRPSPRLETLVTYTKQRIGPISNRPQFAVCNSASLPTTSLASGNMILEVTA